MVGHKISVFNYYFDCCELLLRSYDKGWKNSSKGKGYRFNVVNPVLASYLSESNGMTLTWVS